MPHSLAPYRDQIDELIGPLEEIHDKLDTLISNIDSNGAPPSASFLRYLNIYDAITELQTAVSEIDEYVDDEPEPVGDDDDGEGDEDDQDDDEDDDEDGEDD